VGSGVCKRERERDPKGHRREESNTYHVDNIDESHGSILIVHSKRGEQVLRGGQKQPRDPTKKDQRNDKEKDSRQCKTVQ
jgi:hypothetical protein